MNKNHTLCFLAVSLMSLAGGAYAADAMDSVQIGHPSVIGQVDAGQIVKGATGWNEYNGAAEQKLDGTVIQRTSVWVSQDATVNERLKISVGVGGIFWYEIPTSSNFYDKLTQFVPGISQAQATYSFGDIQKPVAQLEMGYFPYKYNPDAKDLGEYLLRSGTYPGYVMTGSSGGWNLISSNYMMEGVRLNVSLWGGRFQSDFLLPMEHDMPPEYDISPTYVATVKPVKGIEVGAGVDCGHCIAAKPSLESPKIASNGYISSVTTSGSGNQVVYNYHPDNDTAGNPVGYYTFQGVKLEARASVDPKAYFGDFNGLLGPEDLKLYGELAVLGVKDYPGIYNDVYRRMPMMVGVNIPTFKVLDVLSFELQYYNSAFPMSTESVLQNKLPIPDLFGGGDSTGDVYYNRDQRSHWKWAVSASKEVIHGISVFAQVADDEYRTNISGGSQTFVPVVNANGGDWYYLIRLQFGI